PRVPEHVSGRDGEPGVSGDPAAPGRGSAGHVRPRVPPRRAAHRVAAHAALLRARPAGAGLRRRGVLALLRERLRARPRLPGPRRHPGAAGRPRTVRPARHGGRPGAGPEPPAPRPGPRPPPYPRSPRGAPPGPPPPPAR